MARRIVIHNHFPKARDSLSLSKSAIIARERSGKYSWAGERPALTVGSSVTVFSNEEGGKKIAIQVAPEGTSARDVNAFEHALPREKEDENRKRAYAATGIRTLGSALDFSQSAAKKIIEAFDKNEISRSKAFAQLKELGMSVAAIRANLDDAFIGAYD